MRKFKRNKRRARRYRRNPFGARGAIFVSNPRRRRNKRKFKMNRRRRNGLALRLNRKFRRNKRKFRMNRKYKRNGIALRLNRGRYRRNGIALRLNRGRKGSRRYGRRYRRNGLALRLNRGSFKMRRYRRNKGMMGKVSLAPVQRLVRKVPVVGKPVASALPAVLTGAVATIPVGVVGKYLGGYLPMALQPFSNSLTGLAVAVATPMVPGLSKKHKAALATGALIAGGFLDMRDSGLIGRIPVVGPYLSDGQAYDVVPLAGEMGMAEYSGASFGDAALGASDLTDDELGAALRGQGAWRRRFPMAQRVNRVQSPYSPYAQQEGHRWGWLIKLVGFVGFQKIASLPPDQRRKVIQRIRSEVVSNLQGHIDAVAVDTPPAEDLVNLSGAGYGGLLYMGQ